MSFTSFANDVHENELHPTVDSVVATMCNDRRSISGPLSHGASSMTASEILKAFTRFVLAFKKS
jgi:hypothetical protein